jgi:CHASE1-domain containing sensor protein
MKWGLILSHQKVPLRLLKYPLLFSGITFLITIIYCYVIVKNIKAHEQERFNHFVTQVERNITFRMQTYINALVQTKSMFAASNEVTRSEFKRYVSSLDFLKNYPGIQGIGFAKKIEQRHLKEHIKKIQAEGFPQYKVWPDQDRPLYFSIVYLEPFDWRNQRAFGYDMFTEPVRRMAMEKAMETGLPAVSSKVTLVQETKSEEQPGFLIYVPVYLNAADISTIEMRRRNLLGFIYAPFMLLSAPMIFSKK